MARFSSLLITLLVISASFVPQMESRKLLLNTRESNKNVPSLFASLVLSALPKGTVPASTPSKKGHATLDNEKLFARHLARIDRILQSVPSPGAGH
ncbi:C-TERMINALLY ENCODED PEPTIDE 14 [Hibiscus trionum]|uniref:C-TERMINALLY ENCODED PEPTIDE 14 n=1 Tax=Hibiscus trionum TaxID=183268 RepID=A0A9W7IC38_HIBTR|nr:C-TERMINALLY ENCODED PEPTIDE 14 [Hibiscus trionum]